MTFLKGLPFPLSFGVICKFDKYVLSTTSAKSIMKALSSSQLWTGPCGALLITSSQNDIDPLISSNMPQQVVCAGLMGTCIKLDFKFTHGTVKLDLCQMPSWAQEALFSIGNMVFEVCHRHDPIEVNGPCAPLPKKTENWLVRPMNFICLSNEFKSTGPCPLSFCCV